MTTPIKSQFGDIDRYQKKKLTKERIAAALIRAVKAVKHPAIGEYLHQFRANLRPVNHTDDSTLPAGNLVKHDFICRIDKREACLLVFVRYAVMQYWLLHTDQIEDMDPVVSTLEEIVDRYNDAMKVIGSVKDGFTFDTVVLGDDETETEGETDEQG